MTARTPIAIGIICNQTQSNPAPWDLGDIWTVVGSRHLQDSLLPDLDTTPSLSGHLPEAGPPCIGAQPSPVLYICMAKNPGSPPSAAVGASTADTPPPLLIATNLREEGRTGVQTHISPAAPVTPCGTGHGDRRHHARSAGRRALTPVFGLRHSPWSDGGCRACQRRSGTGARTRCSCTRRCGGLSAEPETCVVYAQETAGRQGGAPRPAG